VKTARKRFKFKSVRTRLTFWLLIIALFSMGVVNIAIYYYVVNSLKLTIYNKLEAIRDLKVNGLECWIEERIIDIRTIASDSDIWLLEQISEGKEETRDVLIRYLQNYYEFDEIFIVSPFTGKVLVSTDKNNDGKGISKDTHFEAALQSLKLHIGDIHYSTTLNRPSMAFYIPIFSSTVRDSVTGILVVRTNLETSLYKLLSDYTGMGKTGETLIVNKDVTALNELRWFKNSVLKLTLRSKPAVEASRGKTGIIETADYRQEMVLAAYTYIPRIGWGFVAKQDLKEVYSPINQLRSWMLAIAIITLFGVLVVAFYVSKSISNPIKALHRGSEIIGSGNLDHKVGTEAKDEIGQLSRIIDQMMGNLKTITASRDDLNKEIARRRHLGKMLLDIREHERRRIGYDLHDNLGQQLTAISFKTKGLENTLRKKLFPEAEDAARITKLVEMSKIQVKSLSSSLSPILEKDEHCLMTAMVELGSNSERLFGIPCIVRCSESIPIYNETALIHLYRIAQEAVTNAARHARPGKIEIGLMKKNCEITLTIKDDGAGFVSLNRKDGIGLEIMKHRADIINASLDIQPNINKGTIVTCIFMDKGEKDHKNPEDVS
jgi:signal transduction histidine kinase